MLGLNVLVYKQLRLLMCILMCLLQFSLTNGWGAIDKTRWDIICVLY